MRRNPADRNQVSQSFTDRAVRFVTGTAPGRRLTALAGELRNRHIALHWTNLFGVVSLACVAVLFVTGVFLMFFYAPSGTPVVYHGSYAPLDGATMSKAMQSTLNISFDVQGGMLMRQAHHWAALLLPAALILQLLTTFFTGGFRRPRRLGWVLLFALLIVALVGGWSGYALPDDMLSGTGLRIVEGIVLGIPVVGTWLSTLLFGGEFPGQIIEHLYPIHVALVPVLLIVLLVARIRDSYVKGPAQFPAPGRTESTVVGIPVLPNAAVRAGGLFAMVAGMLFLLSATVTVSPSWLYGPSSGGDASAGSQPDWYTGFLDGALRLVPPGWEFVWLGHTWTLAVLIPLAVVGGYLAVVLLYPFIEERVTGDHGTTTSSIGRGTCRSAPASASPGWSSTPCCGELRAPTSLSTTFQLGVESVVGMFQAGVVLGPIVAFSVTRRICLGLQKRERETLLHGYETGRIVRMPGGEYVEVHQPLDEGERRRLVNASVNGVEEGKG